MVSPRQRLLPSSKQGCTITPQAHSSSCFPSCLHFALVTSWSFWGDCDSSSMAKPSHRLLKEFNPDYRGLRILYDHDDPSVKYICLFTSNIDGLRKHWQSHYSVIAVHGLAADPVGTWVQKKQNWNWLENQLVSSLPRARIWTFGYDSSWCGDFSVETRLHEVAGRRHSRRHSREGIHFWPDHATKASDLELRLRWEAWLQSFLQVWGLLTYIASPAYTSDLRRPQFWRHCRVEGSLSFEHHHVIGADSIVTDDGWKSRQRLVYG
jgi:hypothetical protein